MNGLQQIVVDLMNSDGGKMRTADGLVIEFKPEHEGWHRFILSKEQEKIGPDLSLRFQWAIREVVDTGVVFMQPFHHTDELLGWQFLIEQTDWLKPEYQKERV